MIFDDSIIVYAHWKIANQDYEAKTWLHKNHDMFPISFWTIWIFLLDYAWYHDL